MATRRESVVVYAAGPGQGVVLVTFPATSTVLTDPGEYDLSATQYGVLFIPQVITAIACSLLGSRLARRISERRVYLIGLAASLVAVSVLVASAPFAGDAAAYPMPA